MILPDAPSEFLSRSWAEILPLYDELAARPLDGEAAIEAWLGAWSRLEAMLTEAGAQAMIAYTVDTENPEREAAHLRFSTEIMPHMEEQSVRLARRLVDLKYQRPDLDLVLARFRTQIETFRSESVPLQAELEQLGSRYQKVTGGMTAEWEGRQVALPQLQPYLLDRDRSIRERAFHLVNAPYLAAMDELSEVFDRMYALRQGVAHNAGFRDFRDYSFRVKCRFDYTPADVEAFHSAVEAHVAPAVERMFLRRRDRLGVAAVRPWDTTVDPYGQHPLVPFRDARELEDKALTAARRMDPGLGREFETMVREGLLDLDSRRGKAPGGYCETLHHQGRPFIFMNAAGTLDDVTTLFHEAGHAFHAFASHPLPLIWQRHPGMEAAELASMSMELLAMPFLGGHDGGFFAGRAFARARLHHLEDILVSLAHIAAVDAFQTWIYTSGEGHDRAARDRAWLAIRGRFDRGVDWDGLERERVCRWYRQLHIFLYPFYYIEYGIAQLGALQVWRNSLRAPAEALAAYRRALALGATASLPEIYRTAGARMVFDREGVADLVALLEGQIAAAERDLAA